MHCLSYDDSVVKMQIDDITRRLNDYQTNSQQTLAQLNNQQSLTSQLYVLRYVLGHSLLSFMLIFVLHTRIHMQARAAGRGSGANLGFGG